MPEKFNQTSALPAPHTQTTTTRRETVVTAGPRILDIWRGPLILICLCGLPGVVCLSLASRWPMGGTIGGTLITLAIAAVILGAYLHYLAHEQRLRLERLSYERECTQLAFDKEKVEMARWARARGAATVKLDAGVDITLYYPPPRVVRITQETPATPAIASPLPLPGFILMQEVMRKWDLSPQNLFLGYGKGSQALACTLEGFLHVAHDAPTGQGKTAQFYAEIIMLLKLGVRVILANPHFAPVTRKGEDWRPIARVIEAQGPIELAPGVMLPGLMRGYESIYRMLKWLSEGEIDRRFTMQARGDYSFVPLYIFVDEWPAIVTRFPDAAVYMTDVLQRGRAVLVCVDSNAQGFLVKDVALSGSARENYQTAYHMGGSVHSASTLLDMPVKDLNALMRAEQIPLGKGIALLRNNEASPLAQLVRLPFANNEYAYYMLGRADDWTLPELRSATEAGSASLDERSGEKRLVDALPSVERSASQPAKKPVYVSDEERKRIYELADQEVPMRKIPQRMKKGGYYFYTVKAVLEER